MNTRRELLHTVLCKLPDLQHVRRIDLMSQSSTSSGLFREYIA